MTAYTTDKHQHALQFIDSRESNARTYARTFNRMMARGQLAKVWDVEGDEYLDFLSCAGALPLGHNHPAVMREVEQFLKSGHILQGLDIPTVAKHTFMEQLMQVLPPAFAQHARIQFCGPTGSDAVEAAIKLFKTATGRRSIFAFHGGYHGMTLGALSLMGNLGPKAAITGLAPETHFFAYPHSARCPFGVGGEDGETISLNYMESVLSDPESGITKPAMIILEAVQGEGGCIPAPPQWLRRLRAIADQHDIPLVIDEVQTGFGRTGAMFAHEESGIVPDAVILSKALGGGFPLSLLAYHSRYDKWTAGAHAGTFRGNQIALVAGAATMAYIREHQLHHAAISKGMRLQSGLRALARRVNCIGEVRGRGLMVGAEIVQPGGAASEERSERLDGTMASAIKRECFARGLMIETGGRHGAVLRFLPPLVVSEEEIDHALQILEAAIDAVSSRGQLHAATTTA
ncbi:MAG TPA: diaminobutyrate--2-oxoglutarate transaminase family protein [Burkholderiaceae bacterium]|nr:diaminobutyrate--2-oxoglutarate transaminase family protein [Burkholderiaceae bacterium]